MSKLAVVNIYILCMQSAVFVHNCYYNNYMLHAVYIYPIYIYILHLHTCDAVKNSKDNHYIEEVAKKVAEAMSEFGEVYN